MRELDIRLAKTTQRVRELRLQAREAGEEAERAAGAITGAEVKTPASILHTLIVVSRLPNGGRREGGVKSWD